MVEINLNTLFGEAAKISELDRYTEEVLKLAGEGNEVIITGAAPPSGSTLK